MANESLRDLGLDDADSDSQKPTKTANCEICGSVVPVGKRECEHCSEIRRTSSTSKRIRSSPPIQRDDRSPSNSSWCKWIVATVGILILFAAIRSAPRVDREQRVPANTSVEPSYRDALQVLVDDVDEKLKANIFGQVTVQGNHAFVVVEESYFIRLTPEAQRFALESIRDQWFAKCYGKKITFKTWNGIVVAEL